MKVCFVLSASVQCLLKLSQNDCEGEDDMVVASAESRTDDESVEVVVCEVVASVDWSDV